MPLYQTHPTTIEALQWPGWTDDPWPDERTDFFGGPNALGQYVRSVQVNGATKTELLVGSTWTNLPTWAYVKKDPGPVFSIKPQVTFEQRYEPYTPPA